MEIYRATTLAKVLFRDRVLEARDRKDAALKAKHCSTMRHRPVAQSFPKQSK
jgi:hypothetical protein